MPTPEEWRQQQEQNALYRLSEGDGHLGRFLECGVGNRITTPEQAKLISGLRAMARWRGRGWEWMDDICDDVENYQLTIGAPVNSRTQLLDAVKFERAAAHEKSRLLGVIPGGSGGAGK